MSLYTSILSLFKYNLETDGKNTYNIQLALNDNWDKIDSFAKTILSNIETVKGTITTKFNELNAAKTNLNLSNCTVPYVTACSDLSIFPSFWIKLSNGLLIQGGIANAINIGQSVTISLPYAYANTDFIVLHGGKCTSSSDDPLWLYAQTVDSITIHHPSGGNMDGSRYATPHWITIGKGA